MDESSVNSDLKSGHSLGEREERQQREIEKANAIRRAQYNQMTPQQIFRAFDIDKSGMIDFDEFRAMLPRLGIMMSDAKALKYFSMADSDGSGEIDVYEFKAVMFAVNPDNGNTAGFQPSSLLTPKDTFDMFDVDGSGFLDEDEFFFVLQHLGVQLTDQRQEQLFNKYDKDRSGTIEYDEFKQIWLECADLGKELRARNVRYPKLAPKAQLKRIMKQVLDDEEMSERLALAEARQWKDWQSALRHKRIKLKRAFHRAKLELTRALDLAGQVYTFGTGAVGEFDYDKVNKDLLHGKGQVYGFKAVLDLWRARVRPEVNTDMLALIRRAMAEIEVAVDDNDDVDDDAFDRSLSGKIGGSTMDDSSVSVQVATSPFNGLIVSPNTAPLWGRRVGSVAMSNSTAFALSDLGEIYSWGGSWTWWHRLEEATEESENRGLTTPRTQLLLNTTGANVQSVDEEYLFGEDDSDDLRILERNDKHRDAMADGLKTVLEYFSKWSAPPFAADRYKYFKDVLLPHVTFQEASLACEVRGRRVEGMNKRSMVDWLAEALKLEQARLGVRIHRNIRVSEEEIGQLRLKRRNRMATRIIEKIQRQWEPLLLYMEETAREGKAKTLVSRIHERSALSSHLYNKKKQLQTARADTFAKYAKDERSMDIPISGITPRAPPMKRPKPSAKAIKICAGNYHAGLIHQSGQLYTWGTDGSGRLGHRHMSNSRFLNHDRPTQVEALVHMPVRDISFGYSHSAAVGVNGSLYTWGSAGCGKLGLGKLPDDEECFCEVPGQVDIVGHDYHHHIQPSPTGGLLSSTLKVRSVSCGASHTGCVTEDGEVYMWGSNDGGRLGLPQFPGNVYQPTFISDLQHVKARRISCGSTHTLVSTAVWEAFDKVEGTRKLTGGEVFMAGPMTVLGIDCKSFTKLESMADVPVVSVSAGFNHSGIVTTEGELLCWGFNQTGCCGAPLVEHFIPHPRQVESLYRRPANLALHAPAAQSSVYNNQHPACVVDGDVNGSFNSTQCEPNPWVDIDLGRNACIQKIRLWNRTDEPSDPSMERDLFQRRLFPCYVLLSTSPFPVEVHEDDMLLLESSGVNLLTKSIDASVSCMKFTKQKRCSVWKVPDNTFARYIRVQLEQINFLHFTQIEVLGTDSPVGGRCSTVECSRNVTVATVKPSSDQKTIEKAYLKAVRSDSFNSDILRQYETFSPFFDKFGRGDGEVNLSNPLSLGHKCLACLDEGYKKCECCELLDSFQEDLDSFPLEMRAIRPTLSEIGEYLLTRPKPPLVLDDERKNSISNQSSDLIHQVIRSTGPQQHHAPSEASSISSKDSSLQKKQQHSKGKGRQSHRNTMSSLQEEDAMSEVTMSPRNTHLPLLV